MRARCNTCDIDEGVERDASDSSVVLFAIVACINTVSKVSDSKYPNEIWIAHMIQATRMAPRLTRPAYIMSTAG